MPRTVIDAMAGDLNSDSSSDPVSGAATGAVPVTNVSGRRPLAEPRDEISQVSTQGEVSDSRADAFLRMNDVRFSYSGSLDPVVDHINMALPAGAIHCLLGRSGCGKSTLLKLAAGLLHPDAGTITVDGEPVLEPDLATGFVFQSPTLLAWLDVLDNVLLPVSLHRKPGATDIADAKTLLEQLGLSDLLHRFPHQLSGGQQSRVAIARALLPKPRLLLMDEPFAALDALTREALQDALLAVCASQGVSVLFVTHDIAEAVYLGDRVMVVEQGSLQCDIAVTVGRPRTSGVRHRADFNAVCMQLREVMEAGERAAVTRMAG
jgi:NitT/TauT family transport system ATP-binding protein